MVRKVLFEKLRREFLDDDISKKSKWESLNRPEVDDMRTNRMKSLKMYKGKSQRKLVPNFKPKLRDD